MGLPNKILIGDRNFAVHYEFVAKRMSSVTLKKDVVRIKLSRFARKSDHAKIIERFMNWAIKRLKKIGGAFVLPDYSDGGSVCVHNKIYEIRVHVGRIARSRVSLKEGRLIEIWLAAKYSTGKVRFLVEKVIMEDQTDYLRDVIDELNQLYFQENYNSCRFKRVSSRFGSCSTKKNINIAYRLLFAPREVFRYVCVHELAHLKEMNHSKDFWKLVEAAMSDYKIHEKWLRDNGFLLG